MDVGSEIPHRSGGKRQAMAQDVVGEGDCRFLQARKRAFCHCIGRVTLSGLENLSGFSQGVILTAAQLDGFTGSVGTGGGTLAVSTAGGINLSDAFVSSNTIRLSNFGNTLIPWEWVQAVLEDFKIGCF